ncbi:MAG: cytochrome c, partial [Myxococcales bacterium]|nr:cytochrome c [Myxococcales bacterium]
PAVAGLSFDSELLERGQDRFEIYCTPCHGLAGDGNGVVPTRGWIHPPSFHNQNLQEMPLGYFVQVQHDGVRTMPSYRAQVPARDRWAIAVYIRALQAMTRAGESLGPVATDTEGGTGE